MRKGLVFSTSMVLLALLVGGFLGTVLEIRYGKNHPNQIHFRINYLGGFDLLPSEGDRVTWSAPNNSITMKRLIFAGKTAPCAVTASSGDLTCVIKNGTKGKSFLYSCETSDSTIPCQDPKIGPISGTGGRNLLQYIENYIGLLKIGLFDFFSFGSHSDIKPLEISTNQADPSKEARNVKLLSGAGVQAWVDCVSNKTTIDYVDDFSHLTENTRIVWSQSDDKLITFLAGTTGTDFTKICPIVPGSQQSTYQCVVGHVNSDTSSSYTAQLDGCGVSDSLPMPVYAK